MFLWNTHPVVFDANVNVIATRLRLNLQHAVVTPFERVQISVVDQVDKHLAEGPWLGMHRQPRGYVYLNTVAMAFEGRR